METQNKNEQKPRLEMNLEDMRGIEDEIGQWMILEEHWTANGLDRRQQLDYAKQIYTRLKAKIASAYRTCPAYSEI